MRFLYTVTLTTCAGLRISEAIRLTVRPFIRPCIVYASASIASA